MVEAEFALLMHIVFTGVLMGYLLVCYRDGQVREVMPYLVLKVVFLILAYWRFWKLIGVFSSIHPAGLQIMPELLWLGVFWGMSMIMSCAALHAMKKTGYEEQ